MIKVLSWNIRQGGGSRISKITGAIRDIKSHIVVLSEYRNNDKGIKLRYKLLQLGYRYQVVTAAESHVNSVAVFSNIPMNYYINSENDPEYSNNLIKCEFSAFTLYGGYFPHKRKHQLFTWLIEELTRTEVPFILCGDLNIGKNHIDQKGNSFWYEDDYITLSEDLGRDAFRIIHGNKEEYSWYSHQGNGYRYDHTIISQDLVDLIKDCYYTHDYRVDKSSDHSPMILELG